MPPKKDASSASENAQDPKLVILIAKRNTIFEIVQKVYDLSKDIQTSASVKESFFDECQNIDTLRTEFIQIVDSYNSKLLEIDSTALPDYACLVSFETLYSKIKRIKSQYSQPTDTSSQDVTVAIHKARPTLPPIELMTFSGDIRSWSLFYSSFKSSVHNNPSLTDAERLYYLLGKLTSKALSVCAGISPCAENYHLFLKALIDKYEDKRMLACTYLNNILDFKPLQTASAVNFDLFTTNFVSAVRALQNLKLDNLIDFMLVHIALKNIDSDTVRAFEISNSEKIPTFDALVDFIKNRAKIFERTPASSGRTTTNTNVMSNNRSINNRRSNNAAPLKYQNYYVGTSADSAYKCLCTNITHQHLYQCPDFNNMSPQERFKCVKNNNACVNCLSLRHKLSSCVSNSRCRICKFKHHSFLHFGNAADTAAVQSSPSARPAQSLPLTVRSQRDVEDVRTAVASAPTHSPRVLPSRSDVALCTTNVSLSHLGSQSHNDNTLLANNNIVLLSTAQVVVYDVTGRRHIIRVLLDSASQSHFVTKKCCDKLRIPLPDTKRAIVKGFGGAEKIIKTNSINLKIHSRFDDNIYFDISPLVVDQITDLLPTAMIDSSILSTIADLPLADELFGVPNEIDVLIGASLFPHLLLPDDNRVPSDPSAPITLRTVLGYVVMGSVPTLPTLRTHQVLTCCMVQEPAMLDNLVKRFWELEELSSAVSVQHPADVECEHFYISTTTRDHVNGRYTVSLPFKGDVFSLGDSHNTAYKRFMCLERKLELSLALRSAYDDVIRDYLSKDYIAVAPELDSEDPRPIYIIPHHGVIREDKTSTRLRIVLDASSKTSTGQSLNDILHSGPNLQGDLFRIILNFRLHAVAMTADCRQQFLQIAVREEDRRYQCFLYRFSPQDPLTLYQFNRVCFGLSSSPFHALRTVRQLINDDGEKYPLASNIASSSLYMDDIAFSVPSEDEAAAASLQLISLFKGAQWDLVKWNSNSKCALKYIPATHKLPTEVEFDKSMQYKILGLHWCTDTDSFLFKISALADVTCTKRVILSTIARLWDIMGFTAPTIVYAKLLIKNLWQLGLDWDDTPPLHIVKKWRQFCAELPALNNLRIPRHIGASSDCVVTLFGFSDASEHAYGAVVYLHASTPSGNTVQLVCAKTRVAPTKPITIARLELCGAVLLSKLLRTVLDNYSQYYSTAVYAFVDSMVALYWIKSSPHRWQAFVANRVVQIIDKIPADNFYHVAGIENSADILSRGVTPHKLLANPLWLHGPQWAILNPSQWPLHNLDDQSIADIPEQKILSHAVCTPIKHCALYELATRLSSWSRLLRIVVYVCKFTKLLPRRNTSAVTADDLCFAENIIIRILQNKYFAEEYNNIANNKSGSSAFNRLRPFIDNGLIRVGGRLVNSALDYAHKHPVILPRSDHIVNMIIDYYHVKYLHAGPELLMSLLRQKFWILSARRIIRQRVHLCNICFRNKPRPTYPLMADLPDSRTRQVVKAFTHTGCDYAGPVAYTPVRRRGVRSEKAYLCIFTCLTTRAIHIEIASDLSTPSFLAALKRFLSRRGPVQFMYSDNGTNFKGANSYLRDLYKFLNTEYRAKLEHEYAESRIVWKFICPNSPHFGGAWESMVKVVKTHLFKVIGTQILSYEELSTVLAQIECLLNSRPLTVLSSDPAEPSALTPSHFLHTAPILSLPAPDVSSDLVSLNHRHSLLDKLVQSFWIRWRTEYLHGLQVRQKWNTPSVPITSGTVVVIMSDNVPPLNWPLAVVESVHPSKDGIVRVATVRTARGTYLRPVVRLCPLPTQ